MIKSMYTLHIASAVFVTVGPSVLCILLLAQGGSAAFHANMKDLALTQQEGGYTGVQQAKGVRS